MSKKKETQPLTEGEKEGLWTIAGTIIIIIVLFNAFVFVKDFFSNNSDAKEYCGKSPTVLNARTDAAAKLAYKSCLKSY